jgi:4-carboxymuconolactone decarboxylase
MTDEQRYERGQEVSRRLFGGVIPPLTRDMGTVAELVVKNVINDVWGRDVMPLRDRRLMVMGALASMTLTEELAVHIRAARALGELTWEEIDEIAVALSPYIGAPRTTYVVRLINQLKRQEAD